MQEYIAQTDSTNNRLKERLAAGEELGEGYTLYTFYQTAGRGQAGNSWESEAGQNLLFSTVFRLTDLQPQEQFRLSMLVPLAIVNVLRNVVADEGQRNMFTVKWPNDIYAFDGKLAGILIEHRLTGSRIDASVAGVGLNVNQTDFPPQLINPVSMTLLTGKRYDLRSELEVLAGCLATSFGRLLLDGDPEADAEYESLLYRRGAFHEYSAGPDGNRFEGRIIGVTPDGLLCIETKKGELKKFAFKEISYII